jgi:ParB family transcriptional regulator, chromosome partitioning protein
MRTTPPATPNPFTWRRFANVQMGDYLLGEDTVAYLRRSPEGTLSRLIMEMSILLRMSSGQDSNRVLAEAAKEYSVNVETIASNIKKEFNAREKAKAEKKAVAKAAPAKAVAKKKLAA